MEPPTDRDGTAVRAPTCASGWAAVTSALQAVAMTTAVAVMAVAPAGVDGNATQNEAALNRDVPANWPAQAA